MVSDDKTGDVDIYDKPVKQGGKKIGQVPAPPDPPGGPTGGGWGGNACNDPPSPLPSPPPPWPGIGSGVVGTTFGIGLSDVVATAGRPAGRTIASICLSFSWTP